MSIKETLTGDLKTAMLAGDKTLVTTLRGLKSVILYAEVAQGNRDQGLSDDEVVALFMKEAKKRKESADLFAQGGNTEKAEAELTEKLVIEKYLPAQMSDEDLNVIVNDVATAIGGITRETMGVAIGKVKTIAGPGVDGGRIAAVIKAQIQS